MFRISQMKMIKKNSLPLWQLSLLLERSHILDHSTSSCDCRRTVNIEKATRSKRQVERRKNEVIGIGIAINWHCWIWLDPDPLTSPIDLYRSNAMCGLLYGRQTINPSHSQTDSFSSFCLFCQQQQRLSLASQPTIFMCSCTVFRMINHSVFLHIAIQPLSKLQTRLINTKAVNDTIQITKNGNGGLSHEIQPQVVGLT